MKVLICGSRNYNDYDKIYNYLKNKSKYDDIIVVEGGAPGADLLSKKAAISLNIEYREYKADWKKYGRAAGPKRNQQMLDCESPDLVVAFHPNIDESKGTKDMINRSKKANIPIEIYS
ncbi:MAG TPA: DUF2493 domain-containing protein [Clostridium sp.]|nr:DUF2493 domain-containing protein [Clostridium sp.]